MGAGILRVNYVLILTGISICDYIGKGSKLCIVSPYILHNLSNFTSVFHSPSLIMHVLYTHKILNYIQFLYIICQNSILYIFIIQCAVYSVVTAYSVDLRHLHYREG